MRPDPLLPSRGAHDGRRCDRRPPRLAAALLVVALAAPAGRAQDIELEAVRARWRATFELLDPDGADDLWVGGLHYDLLDRFNFLPTAYVGVGGYGALAGDRGGLLVAGLTVGVREKLTDEITVDLGAFLGGGGGDFVDGVDPTEAWGGGLYLRPHVAFELGGGLTRWRLELSQVNVPGGDLQSTQIALGIQGFDELITADYTIEALSELDPAALIDGELPITLGTRWLFPVGNGERRNGQDLEDPIALASLSIERGLVDDWYVPIELAGAFAGSVSGYAQLLVGIGHRLALGTSPFAWRNQFAFGGGGGGRVDTGGGLLLSAESGLEARLGQSWRGHLLGGFQIAPTGDFQTLGFSLGASYAPTPIELRNGYPREMLSEQGLYSFDVDLEPWTIEVVNKLYAFDSDARRIDGSAIEDDIPLVGLGLSKQVAEYRGDWDISARAFAAWDGEIPGYHEGQLGLRYTLPRVLDPVDAGRFYVQYHLGAAGGGGLDNGSGLTHNLVAGWRWRPWRGLRLGFEAGRVESEQGSLDGDLYALTLSFGVTRALRPEQDG